MRRASPTREPGNAAEGPTNASARSSQQVLRPGSQAIITRRTNGHFGDAEQGLGSPLFPRDLGTSILGSPLPSLAEPPHFGMPLFHQSPRRSPRRSLMTSPGRLINHRMNTSFGGSTLDSLEQLLHSPRNFSPTVAVALSMFGTPRNLPLSADLLTPTPRKANNCEHLLALPAGPDAGRDHGMPPPDAPGQDPARLSDAVNKGATGSGGSDCGNDRTAAMLKGSGLTGSLQGGAGPQGCAQRNGALGVQAASGGAMSPSMALATSLYGFPRGFGAPLPQGTNGAAGGGVGSGFGRDVSGPGGSLPGVHDGLAALDPYPHYVHDMLLDDLTSARRNCNYDFCATPRNPADEAAVANVLGGGMELCGDDPSGQAGLSCWTSRAGEGGVLPAVPPLIPTLPTLPVHGSLQISSSNDNSGARPGAVKVEPGASCTRNPTPDGPNGRPAPADGQPPVPGLPAPVMLNSGLHVFMMCGGQEVGDMGGGPNSDPLGDVSRLAIHDSSSDDCRKPMGMMQGAGLPLHLQQFHNHHANHQQPSQPLPHGLSLLGLPPSAPDMHRHTPPADSGVPGAMDQQPPNRLPRGGVPVGGRPGGKDGGMDRSGLPPRAGGGLVPGSVSMLPGAPGASSTPSTLQRPQRTRTVSSLYGGATSAYEVPSTRRLAALELEGPHDTTGTMPPEGPNAGHRVSSVGGGGGRGRRNSESNSKSCRCKKSQCLKLYCDCFAAGQYCGACSCVACQNREEYASLVQQRREEVVARDPDAFIRKIVSAPNGNGKHKRGCNCRRSHCLKKYCECYQGGVKCGMQCTCLECENMDMRSTVSEGGRGGGKRSGAKGARGGPSSRAGSRRSSATGAGDSALSPQLQSNSGCSEGPSPAPSMGTMPSFTLQLQHGVLAGNHPHVMQMQQQPYAIIANAATSGGVGGLPGGTGMLTGQKATPASTASRPYGLPPQPPQLQMSAGLPSRGLPLDGAPHGLMHRSASLPVGVAGAGAPGGGVRFLGGAGDSGHLLEHALNNAHSEPLMIIPPHPHPQQLQQQQHQQAPLPQQPQHQDGSMPCVAVCGPTSQQAQHGQQHSSQPQPSQNQQSSLQQQQQQMLQGAASGEPEAVTGGEGSRCEVGDEMGREGAGGATRPLSAVKVKDVPGALEATDGNVGALEQQRRTSLPSDDALMHSGNASNEITVHGRPQCTTTSMEPADAASLAAGATAGEEAATAPDSVGPAESAEAAPRPSSHDRPGAAQPYPADPKTLQPNQEPHEHQQHQQDLQNLDRHQSALDFFFTPRALDMALDVVSPPPLSMYDAMDAMMFGMSDSDGDGDGGLHTRLGVRRGVRRRRAGPGMDDAGGANTAAAAAASNGHNNHNLNHHQQFQHPSARNRGFTARPGSSRFGTAGMEFGSDAYADQMIAMIAGEAARQPQASGCDAGGGGGPRRPGDGPPDGGGNGTLPPVGSGEGAGAGLFCGELLPGGLLDDPGADSFFMMCNEPNWIEGLRSGGGGGSASGTLDAAIASVTEAAARRSNLWLHSSRSGNRFPCTSPSNLVSYDAVLQHWPAPADGNGACVSPLGRIGFEGLGHRLSPELGPLVGARPPGGLHRGTGSGSSAAEAASVHLLVSPVVAPSTSAGGGQLPKRKNVEPREDLQGLTTGGLLLEDHWGGGPGVPSLAGAGLSGPPGCSSPSKQRLAGPGAMPPHAPPQASGPSVDMYDMPLSYMPSDNAGSRQGPGGGGGGFRGGGGGGAGRGGGGGGAGRGGGGGGRGGRGRNSGSAEKDNLKAVALEYIAQRLGNNVARNQSMEPDAAMPSAGGGGAVAPLASAANGVSHCGMPPPAGAVPQSRQGHGPSSMPTPPMHPQQSAPLHPQQQQQPMAHGPTSASQFAMMSSYCSDPAPAAPSIQAAVAVSGMDKARGTAHGLLDVARGPLGGVPVGNDQPPPQQPLQQQPLAMRLGASPAGSGGGRVVVVAGGVMTTTPSGGLQPVRIGPMTKLGSGSTMFLSPNSHHRLGVPRDS